VLALRWLVLEPPPEVIRVSWFLTGPSDGSACVTRYDGKRRLRVRSRASSAHMDVQGRRADVRERRVGVRGHPSPTVVVGTGVPPDPDAHHLRQGPLLVRSDEGRRQPAHAQVRTAEQLVAAIRMSPPATRCSHPPSPVGCSRTSSADLHRTGAVTAARGTDRARSRDPAPDRQRSQQPRTSPTRSTSACPPSRSTSTTSSGTRHPREGPSGGFGPGRA
jgi:hypothetical protein